MSDTRPLVILFGGAGREGAVLSLHDAGEEIALVCVPSPTPARLAAAVTALAESGLRVVALDRSQLHAGLLPYAGAQLVSIGFPYLLSRELLSAFPGALNVHPTRLPTYRGPTTGAHVIMNGESVAGSTVHLIDEGMDTGAIVVQSDVPLSMFDTVTSMQRKVYASEPALLAEALARVRCDDFEPTLQDELMASVYPRRRRPADSAIDADQSLRSLYNVIRGCDPDAYPAFFEVDGQQVCIRLWRPSRPATDGDDMI